MEKYCLCGYLCASLDAQFSKFSLRQTNVASPKVDIWVAINQNLTPMISDAPMIRYSVQTVQTGHNKYVSSTQTENNLTLKSAKVTIFSKLLSHLESCNCYW